MNGTTPDFILVNFKVKDPKGQEQQGAYILPKRMDSKTFLSIQFVSI